MKRVAVFSLMFELLRASTGFRLHGTVKEMEQQLREKFDARSLQGVATCEEDEFDGLSACITARFDEFEFGPGAQAEAEDPCTDLFLPFVLEQIDCFIQECAAISTCSDQEEFFQAQADATENLIFNSEYAGNRECDFDNICELHDLSDEYDNNQTASYDYEVPEYDDESEEEEYEDNDGNGGEDDDDDNSASMTFVAATGAFGVAFTIAKMA